MGVYVYKSKYINAIKVGHYCKNNAWSRIAHRGFYSCICPYEIKERVSVEDVILLYWYPCLTRTDEKKIQKSLNEFRICGEWFRSEAIDKLIELVTEENKASSCSKEEALQTTRRL